MIALPLETLAHFAASNKVANGATSFMLSQAREVHREVVMYSPMSDAGASVFQTHCAAIAGLPKNPQLKPLMRLAHKIGVLPEGARLSGFRAIADWLPDDRAAAGTVMASQIPVLPAVDRMPAFRQAADLCADWVGEPRATMLDELMARSDALPEGDHLEAFTVIRSLLHGLPERDTTGFAIQLIRRLPALPAGTKFTSFLIFVMHCAGLIVLPAQLSLIPRHHLDGLHAYRRHRPRNVYPAVKRKRKPHHMEPKRGCRPLIF